MWLIWYCSFNPLYLLWTIKIIYFYAFIYRKEVFVFSSSGRIVKTLSQASVHDSQRASGVSWSKWGQERKASPPKLSKKNKTREKRYWDLKNLNSFRSLTWVPTSVRIQNMKQSRNHLFPKTKLLFSYINYFNFLNK